MLRASRDTSTVTTTISDGFNSDINLSASGVPDGTTVTFDPQTIPAPGAGNSAMTVVVGSNTALGTYPITVTGSGGGIQQTTTVTLTVTAAASFTISASPASLFIVQGNPGTSTITTAISDGFNSDVALSAAGMPDGTTVTFNPQTIPSPGSGNSTMTITVGGSTPVGVYPITVTGNGGGSQQNTTVTLTVLAWQQGFDFRNTATFVTDPPGDTYVLSNMIFPTSVGDLTFGWSEDSVVGATDGDSTINPRLAGINSAANGTPATFYVDLPAPGNYNLTLAMGDAAATQCATRCQVQFLDGSNVLGTVTGGEIAGGSFYDAHGNRWSASDWSIKNVPLLVSVTGTQLTVLVGTGDDTGDSTPIAYLGLTPVSDSPNFTISASPASLSVVQGNQGTSTITTTISGGFNSAIILSASGVPSGHHRKLQPPTIPAPGAGSSIATITVGSSTPLGTYPITVTGNGGGIQQNTIVTLTVAAPANFTISASPASLSIAQGNQDRRPSPPPSAAASTATLFCRLRACLRARP